MTQPTLNQEALAAATEAFIDNGDETLFFNRITDKALCAAIRAYLEALPPVDAEKYLGELLAIIHRDGGHYQETHGTEKAVNDAHLIWADLMRTKEAAEAEVARLKAELAEAHRVINGVLTFKIEHDASCDHPHICECGADAVRDMARSFRDGQKTGEEG